MADVVEFPRKQEPTVQAVVAHFLVYEGSVMEAMEAAAERWPDMSRETFDNAIAEVQSIIKGRIERGQGELDALIEEARATLGDVAAERLKRKLI